MKNSIQSLRRGEIIQKVIVVGTTKIVRHIQLNRAIKGIGWNVYHLPINRDKSKAILVNENLRLKEVASLI